MPYPYFLLGFLLWTTLVQAQAPEEDYFVRKSYKWSEALHHNEQVEQYRVYGFVPNNLAQFPNLKRVDLCQEGMDLPLALAKLEEVEQLEELTFFFAHLTEVPKGLQRLTQLRTLDFGENPHLDYTEVYPLLAKLPQLTHLKVTGLKSAEQLKGIEQLTQLTNLTIDYCTLRSFDWEKAMTYLAALPRLHTLDMEEGTYTVIPANIALLPHLTTLMAGASGLDLETSFAHLAKVPTLKELYLDDNRLQALPDNLQALQGLERLHLSSAKLTELPAVITTLVNLQELHLYDNELKTLPEEFGNLQQLTYLNLARNPLEVFPASFAALKNLKRLNLEDVPNLNQLLETALQVASLQELNLRNLDTELTAPAQHKNLTTITIKTMSTLVDWQQNSAWLLGFKQLKTLKISGVKSKLCRKIYRRGPNWKCWTSTIPKPRPFPLP